MAAITLLLLSLIVHGGLTQSCSLVTHSVLTQLIPQVHPLSDGDTPTFQLQDFNVTCLSLSSTQDKYHFITISVSYNIMTSSDNRTVTALVDLGCSNSNQWEPSVLGAEVSFKPSQPVPKNALRKDCSICISDTHPWMNSSDPYTHCKGITQC